MWVGGALFLPPTCVCGVDSWRAGTHADQRGKVSREAPHAPGRCLGEPRARGNRHDRVLYAAQITRKTPRAGEAASKDAPRARKRARMLCLLAGGRPEGALACGRPERALAGGETRGSPSVRPGRRALPTASLTRPGRDHAHRPRCWRTRCSGTGSSARGSRPRRGVRPRDESRARIG